MSSLRNAAPNRKHLERAQPHSRARHGLLEKHKDYALRAKDHNEKKARLRLLRQKARDRNPDEFAFAMMGSRTTGGGVKVAERGEGGAMNKGMKHETVMLLKTQDKGYLRTARDKARRERERLEEEIVLRGEDEDRGGKRAALTSLKDWASGNGTAKSTHTVFVDDEDEQKRFDAAEWFDTDEAGLLRTYNRPRKSGTVNGHDMTIAGNGVEVETGEQAPKKLSQREQELQHQAWKAERKVQQQREHHQEKLRKQLEAAKLRERELAAAERELDRQRAQMSGSAGGVNKNGVKFKTRERKK